jgi:hypothetical protein
MRDRIQGSLVAAIAVAFVCGCGGTEVKLADAPPAEIKPLKEGPVAKDRAGLQKGAPPPGSSSGINFNPSETKPPPR